MSSQRNVAVVLNLNKDYDRKIGRGISAYAREVGNWSVYLEDDFANRLPSFRQWHGDGIIANLDEPKVVSQLKKSRIPIVGVGGASDERSRKLRTSYIATDNRRIAELAVEHLVNRGLREFAFCGIPASALDPRTAWVVARRDAFVDTLRSLGFDCSDFKSRYQNPKDWEHLQKELMAWLEQLPKPIGILACDDPRGRHVIMACRRSGIRVPDDVAVLGVDNDELMCEMIQPLMSSIVQGAAKIGFLAGQTLDQLMKGKREYAFKTVPPIGIATRRSTDTYFVEDPLVASCLKFIRDQVEQNLRAHDVAAHADCSRETLDIRFERGLGITVFEAIQRHRLDAAKDLLYNTTIPLRAIADRLGFSSEQYFVSWFRRLHGSPPGAFRDSNARSSGSG